jgi:hypothetical protein
MLTGTISATNIPVNSADQSNNIAVNIGYKIYYNIAINNADINH